MNFTKEFLAAERLKIETFKENMDHKQPKK